MKFNSEKDQIMQIDEMSEEIRIENHFRDRINHLLTKENKDVVLYHFNQEFSQTGILSKKTFHDHSV